MSSGPIRFACPYCRGSIRAPSSQSGQTVQCPRCEATVVVPEEDAATPVVQATTHTETGTRSSRARPQPIPPVDDPPLQPSDDGPLRIDDLEPTADEFSVGCPVCGTRLSATPSQIGTAVSCPDCYSPVPILPNEAGLRPGIEKPLVAEDAFDLSEPVSTPRFVPSAAADIEFSDLYVDPSAQPNAVPQARSEGPEEFSVGCPICHTRLGARASQIGKSIRCPDCETHFVVHAPKKAPPQRVVLDEDDGFRLSDPFERPKYQSTTRDAVSREKLDEIEFLHPPPPPPRVAATPTGTTAAQDFFVLCPICSSRVGARHDQVGKKVICSDCTSEVLITPPPRKVSPAPTTYPDIDDADELAITLPDAAAISPADQRVAAPTVTTGVVEIASREALQKAEEEHLDREAAVALRSLPPFQQLFSVLADPSVLYRIMWMSVLVLMQLSLLSWMMQLSGNSVLFLPVIVLFMVGFALPLIGYGATAMVSIVQCTAGGQVKIEEWNDDFFHDALGGLVQVIVAVSISTLPGAVLSSMAISLGAPTNYAALLLPISLFLLFPFVFLSELEGGHPFHVFSWQVAQSVQRAPAAWLRCYAETLVLLLLTCGLVLISTSTNLFVRTIAAFGMITMWTLTLRSIGILAYNCNRALLDSSYASRAEDSLE